LARTVESKKDPIKDSVIWSQTRIRAHARIERAIIGRQCHIGEGARVRPGTVLGDKPLSPTSVL